MKLETLKDLYIHELKDLYSAENQIIKALPKMAKAASNPKLAAGFKKHLEESKAHAARLEKILTSHGESTRGPKCKGMEGVLKEGQDMIEEDADEDVRDAASSPRRSEWSITRSPATARRGPMPISSAIKPTPRLSRRRSMKRARRIKS